MYVLNYWHTVSDYAEWKKIFDSDPLGREASGVRRVSIERPVDDEHTVIGELEFDSLGEAETFAGRLEEVWKGSASQTVSTRDTASPRCWSSSSSAASQAAGPPEAAPSDEGPGGSGRPARPLSCQDPGALQA